MTDKKGRFSSGEPESRHVAIAGVGMVTALGGDVDSSCAAMRVRFNNHKETAFKDRDHEPIIGSRTPIDPSLFGDARLVEMMVHALAQTNVQLTPEFCANVPLALCTPETETVGRPNSDLALIARLERRLGVQFKPGISGNLPHGHVSGLMALQIAQNLLYEQNFPCVLVLAADSLLNAEGLASLDEHGKLLTPSNDFGVIPGEAAVALWLTRPLPGAVAPLIVGTSFANINPLDETGRPAPVTGRELAQVTWEACAQARCPPASIDLRLADCNGLDVRFKESALAEGIVFKDNPSQTMPSMWQPAECLGEIGASLSLSAIAWALHAYRKGYLPASAVNSSAHRYVLLQASNDGLQRAAAILRFGTGA